MTINENLHFSSSTDNMKIVIDIDIFLIVTGTLYTISILVYLIFYFYLKNKSVSRGFVITNNPYYNICDFQDSKRVNPHEIQDISEPLVNSCSDCETGEWEIRRDDIQVLELLGQGCFGKVYFAKWKHKSNKIVPCAIKTIDKNKNNAEISNNLISEANMMSEFCSPHIVHLFGVVSQSQPVFYLMELMPLGDLRTYLLKRHPQKTTDPLLKPPTLRDILRMAIEIADGMAYLSSKKYIHRDLAARNCMITANNVIKVGDFGLAKNVQFTHYYIEFCDCLLPVRWMAPESFEHAIFTYYSDVWSYGVVLWEMVTLGVLPYKGVDNHKVISYVVNGGIMEKPDKCPNILYDLMQCCWCYNPIDRPTFDELVEMLLPYARPDFDKVSFYHYELRKETLNAPENNIV